MGWSFAAALLLLAALAPVAYADGLTNGRILIHADFVLPGAAARITGTDLDESPVVIRLERAEHAPVVGEAVVLADGTLDATFTVPTDFPLGYATLAVEGSEGASWSSVVLIGSRAEGPGNRPAGSIDERAIALAVMGIGIAIFAVALMRYLRPARRT